MTTTPDDIKDAVREIFDGMRFEAYVRTGPGDEDFDIAEDELKRRIENAILAERERCAQIAYRICAETRHVTLGDACATAIPHPNTDAS